MQRDRASCIYVYVYAAGKRTPDERIPWLGSLDGLSPLLVERVFFSRGIHFVLGAADKLSKQMYPPKSFFLLSPSDIDVINGSFFLYPKIFKSNCLANYISFTRYINEND